MMSPDLNNVVRPGFGMPSKETVIKGAVESQKQEATDNPDFEGKMDDPKVRGAESQADIIMSEK